MFVNKSSGCANVSVADRIFDDASPLLFLSRQKNYVTVILSTVTTPELLSTDYEALANFRYAMRKFLSFSRRALKAEARLTPEQYEVLLALKAFSGSTGLTIRELSERLQVKHHSAGSLIDKLETMNLLRRQAGVVDRRHVFVRLTPAGSRVLAKVAAIHRRELRVRSPEMIEALLRLRE
jgi:DNA-binding MarR family transcriptional regulator